MAQTNETRPRWSGPFLILVTSLFWMSNYTYSALLTPYLEKLGISLTLAGFIVGSYGFTQMALRFPLGILSDRVGRNKMFVIAGLAASLISSLGLAFTQEPWLILVFRGMSGVSASFWVQISTLYISYYEAPGERTKAVSRISFIQNLGTILGTFFGSATIARFGYRPGFMLGVVLAAVGIVLAFFLWEKPATVKAKPESAIATLKGLKLSKSPLLWASLLAAVSQMINFGTSQGFVPRYASDLGASGDWIGVVLTLTHISRAVGTLLSGQVLIRWFTPRQQLLATAVLNANLALLLPFTTSLAWLLPHQMLSSICVGVQMTLLMDRATADVGPGQRTTAMGFFQAVYGIGMVTGPALMGWLSDLMSLSAGFTVIGILGLFGAALMYFKLKDPVA